MNAEAIGKRISELTYGRDKTEIAEALGISSSALRMYEAGQRIPKDEIKIKIAKYFNMTVQEIFFDN